MRVPLPALLLLLSLPAVLLIVSPAGFAGQRPAVAIIIDDLGHNYRRGRQAITMKGAFTYAILPQTRYATRLAKHAHKHNKEVMVHLPMESIGGYPFGIDGDGLTRSLSKQEFIHILTGLIDSIPHARGVNNHQGSLLTQQYKEMHWVMDEVNRRRLFFIDSRTTHQTVATNVASVRDIFSATRDVFLDVERSEFFVDRSFNKLIRIAQKRGTAIAIGHPHKVTIRYLKTAGDKLKRKGIDLIPASNLIALQKINALALTSNQRSAL